MILASARTAPADGGIILRLHTIIPRNGWNGFFLAYPGGWQIDTSRAPLGTRHFQAIGLAQGVEGGGVADNGIEAVERGIEGGVGEAEVERGGAFAKGERVPLE